MTDDIYKIFDSDGLLKQTIDSFEFREDQLNMALDVANCYAKENITVIEAGTGIGKSFAYLVPALLQSFEDPSDRTVIATSTINLQKQLIEKDLPALFKMFGKSVKVSLAVGRNNYLCLRRLSVELSNNALFSSEDDKSPLNLINRFSANTETGLRSDFPGKLDYSVWSTVCSDGDFCMGLKCPFFKECFYFKAREKLSTSSIIICNHHLLFVDSNTRLESNEDYTTDCVLPPFNRLVIDESHNIERHATDLFTCQFSSQILKRQLSFIYDDRFKASSVMKLLDELASYCKDKELYKQIVDFILLVNVKAETLNMSLLSFMQVNGLVHILLTAKNAPKVFESSMSVALDLLEQSKRLLGRLTTFSSGLIVDEERKIRVDELNIHISRIKSIVDNFNTFLNWDSWNDDVHFIEIERHSNSNYAVLKTAPIDVAPLLREALFRKVGSIVCTSATLDLKDDFNYWSNSVGLPVKDKDFVRKVYNSPFDYKSRLMLLTPYDALNFDKDNQNSYAQFLCSSIYDAVSSAGGGSLVLFTSVKLMDYVYTNLLPRFAALDLHCMKQGDADRYSLLQMFKEDTDSVLFATDSFWEGVDAPGNTLRLVIITKLPFKMPDEPIYKARYRRLEEQGKSAFFSLSLPDATMRLKQGFGRLMRHTTDKGIVLILDSRIINKGYGALMLHSLPESYNPECTVSTLASKIETFLY